MVNCFKPGLRLLSLFITSSFLLLLYHWIFFYCSTSGILEFFVFIGGTVGQAISGKIIESNSGYKAPYWIVCSCMLAATLYSIFLVPETLPIEQRDKADFFDRKHFRAILNVVRKPHKKSRDKLRRLILLGYILNVSYFGAYTVTILFLLDRPLCWSPLDIGLFCAERLFCLGVGAVIGVKVLSRCLSTVHIMYLGLSTYIASLIIFAFAKNAGLVVSGKMIVTVKFSWRSNTSFAVSPLHTSKNLHIVAALLFKAISIVFFSGGIKRLLFYAG